MSSSRNSADKEKREIFKYFEIIFSKASKLILLNLIYFICILPIFCAGVYLVCTLFEVSVELIQKIYFVHLTVWITGVIPTPLFFLLLVVSVVCYGPLTAGFTYCIRNIANGEHFWISDMFTRAKSNLKQGIVFGLIDLIVLLSCLLYISADISVLQGGNLFFYQIARILALIIFAIYMWIRFYSYTIAVTVELRIKDIFKNSLIFCVLGFFRNIISTAVCLFVILTFTSTPKVDIALIAALIFSVCRFTAVFSTYPIINKYMLKPTDKK